MGDVLRILGIDPGSRVCGYGVIELDPDAARAPVLARGSVVSSRLAGLGGEVRYVECGILTAPEDRAMEVRLGEIARGLREVIAELAPEVVAVEDVFSHDNPRSALALAQARGMALAVCGLAGLAVASYAPALVKKTVTGNGRSDKQQVAAMVAGIVGLRSLPRADATDALAVAITHARAARPVAARLAPSVIVPGAPR